MLKHVRQLRVGPFAGFIRGAVETCSHNSDPNAKPPKSSGKPFTKRISALLEEVAFDELD